MFLKYYQPSQNTYQQYKIHFKKDYNCQFDAFISPYVNNACALIKLLEEKCHKDTVNFVIYLLDQGLKIYNIVIIF